MDDLPDHHPYRRGAIDAARGDRRAPDAAFSPEEEADYHRGFEAMIAAKAPVSTMAPKPIVEDFPHWHPYTRGAYDAYRGAPQAPHRLDRETGDNYEAIVVTALSERDEAEYRRGYDAVVARGEHGSAA